MASQTPEATAPEAQVSKVGPTSVEAAPKTGEQVIKYVGIRADYVGLKGSHREVTLTQFKEAGVDKPFTDSRTSVMWTPEGGYSVPKSVFTPEALQVLAAQDDLEEGTSE